MNKSQIKNMMKIVCLTNAVLVDIEISMKIRVLEKKKNLKI